MTDLTSFAGIKFKKPASKRFSTRIFDFLKSESQTSFSIIETYMKAHQQGEQIYYSDIGTETWFDMGTPLQLERLRHKLSQTE